MKRTQTDRRFPRLLRRTVRPADNRMVLQTQCTATDSENPSRDDNQIQRRSVLTELELYDASVPRFPACIH